MEEWTTKKIDQYIILNDKLGRGSYGTVYRGYLESNNKQLVAAKQIPMKEICKSFSRVQFIKREIENLQVLNSKYIVKLHAVSRTQSNLYMFLEYCMDGDLKGYIKKKQGKMLSEPEAIQFFKHIVEGFKELYKNKIIHRDVKPANILLNMGIAKLADFGFSRVIEDDKEAKILSFLGSPLYMAPQIQQQQPFSSKCDVWSVGIVFYEILYGRTPWNGANPNNLLENILSQPLTFPEEPVRSNKVKSLIRKMLQLEEQNRISWPEVFEDNLVVGLKRTMEESLKKMSLLQNDLETSVIENDVYMQKHLVVNYLDNIDEEEEITENKKKPKKNTIDFEDWDETDDLSMEENHQDIMDERNNGAKIKLMPFKSNVKSANSFSQTNEQSLTKTKPQSEKTLENEQIYFDKNNKTDISEEKSFFEEKAEQLIKEQIEAEKMRKNILKVNEYMLYERNVSFFYNFVIQKLIQAFNDGIIKLPFDLHYRVVFIISKCQNINLNKVNAMLSSPRSEFNQTIWDCYQSSLDFLKTQKLLVQDVWFAKKFFNELLKKTTQLVDELLKKQQATNPQFPILQNYKKQLNSTMIQDLAFKQVYQKTLNEILNILKPQVNNTENRDLLIIVKYLMVCQNPYSVFNNSDFDFGKFYESLENSKMATLKVQIIYNQIS